MNRRAIRVFAQIGLLMGLFVLCMIFVTHASHRRQSTLRVATRRPTAIKPAPIALPPMTDHFAVPVLMYHRICDLTPEEAKSDLVRDLTVSPKDFEAQVKYLAENGFTFLLARDVEDAVRSGKPLPKKAVAITMDDGYKDNFEQAFPILRKYGARATIFLVTNTVDTSGHVSWADVGAMKPDVGFGSHTVHHYELTELTVPQMDYELRVSKRVIEDRLVERVTAVAYPSGKYNRTVTERAEAAGYLAGWKKGGGPVEPGRDPFLLPRVRVQGHTTIEDFRRKVCSGLFILADRQEDGWERIRRNGGSPTRSAVSVPRDRTSKAEPSRTAVQDDGVLRLSVMTKAGWHTCPKAAECIIRAGLG
jgi:peptidoglycan/xylan/chitin deacetylase (PgdA/CDA1 family)